MQGWKRFNQNLGENAKFDHFAPTFEAIANVSEKLLWHYLA